MFLMGLSEEHFCTSSYFKIYSACACLPHAFKFRLNNELSIKKEL